MDKKDAQDKSLSRLNLIHIIIISIIPGLNVSPRPGAH